MRLNCVLVAVALWYRARFRSGLAMKRSEGLHGMIPHFLHLREMHRGDPRIRLRGGMRPTDLLVEDFIPRRRKSRFTDEGDSFVVFDGLFRTRIYRLVATSTGSTLFEARRGALGLARSSQPSERGSHEHE